MAMKVRSLPVRINPDRDPNWVCCRCGRALGLRPDVIPGFGLVCEGWCR